MYYQSLAPLMQSTIVHSTMYELNGRGKLERLFYRIPLTVTVIIGKIKDSFEFTYPLANFPWKKKKFTPYTSDIYVTFFRRARRRFVTARERDCVHMDEPVYRDVFRQPLLFALFVFYIGYRKNY